MGLGYLYIIYIVMLNKLFYLKHNMNLKELKKKVRTHIFYDLYNTLTKKHLALQRYVWNSNRNIIMMIILFTVVKLFAESNQFRTGFFFN